MTFIEADLARLRSGVDPRCLRVIVLPTEQCNFRCNYCYEDFELGHMAPTTVMALKTWLLSRLDDVESLNVSWFGGEPTLALSTVLDVTTTMRDAYGRAGSEFSSGMTTNGYRLDESRFTSLVQAGVSHFQVTLDGPADVHDGRRRRRDGAGTFDRIWSNLRMMADLARSGAVPAFSVGLRLHYDRGSARRLPALVDAIDRELLPSGAFGVQFHELERLGGEHDADIDLPGAAEHGLARALARRLRGDEPPSARASVVDEIDGYVCYAAKANAYVVRSDGRIGKCTVALNDPRNDVGRLEDDGTITWFPGRIDPWLRGLSSGDARDLACPLDGMSEAVPVELSRRR